MPDWVYQLASTQREDQLRGHIGLHRFSMRVRVLLCALMAAAFAVAPWPFFAVFLVIGVWNLTMFIRDRTAIARLSAELDDLKKLPISNPYR